MSYVSPPVAVIDWICARVIRNCLRRGRYTTQQANDHSARVLRYSERGMRYAHFRAADASSHRLRCRCDRVLNCH